MEKKFIPEVSIILPAYNEEKNIAKTISTLISYLSKNSIESEIIVINDGSTDETGSIAEQFSTEKIKLLSYEKNMGKGYAVNYGMKNSAGNYKIFMDVDLSTDISCIKQFYEHAKKNNSEVIIGTRKVKFANQIVRQPFYRIWLGRCFTLISNLLTLYPVSDFTCGFKLFSKNSAEIIFSKQTLFDWSFDTEIIYIAQLKKIKIEEIPVIWKNDPDTKVSIFRDALRSLIGLFNIKINDIRGVYN